jgi:hypothetical protein
MVECLPNKTMVNALMYSGEHLPVATLFLEANAVPF